MHVDEGETFHTAASRVLYITQFFALLPVTDVTASDVYGISYRWLSPRTCYAALIMLLNLSEFVSVLNFVANVDLNFHNSGTISLYVVCLLEHIYFWRLATKWPLIMRMWHSAEEIFLRAPYRCYANYRMKLRIHVVFGFVMISALVEHCLLLMNSVHLSSLERTQCKLNVTFMESLYKWERPHLYIILPYRIWLLPLIEWINLTMAYPRSFTDVFIMCFGIGLAARFHQLHQRIMAVHKKPMPGLFWTEVRQHYLILKRLLRILNQQIAPFVLLAFGNNLYFICFQLFNSFKNIGVSFVIMLAFWYSLGFAVLRTLMTLFIAASINDFTKKISTCLRDVPSGSWCVEAERFSEQLANDLTAFSGSGLFFLTRKLILAMATTIITYELMISDIINQGTIRQKTQYCRDY